jgi:hypothetical protein
MRTAIIIALVVALGVAVLIWRRHREKEQEQETSPSLVNQSDLMEDRSNMETILPPDMDWEAVGSHLKKDSIDYDAAYQKIQRGKTIKSLADESALLYGGKDSGTDDDTITNYATWSTTRHYTKKEWDEEQARGRAAEEEYDLGPYM